MVRNGHIKLGQWNARAEQLAVFLFQHLTSPPLDTLLGEIPNSHRSWGCAHILTHTLPTNTHTHTDTCAQSKNVAYTVERDSETLHTHPDPPIHKHTHTRARLLRSVRYHLSTHEEVTHTHTRTVSRTQIARRGCNIVRRVWTVTLDCGGLNGWNQRTSHEGHTPYCYFCAVTLDFILVLCGEKKVNGKFSSRAKKKSRRTTA